MIANVFGGNIIEYDAQWFIGNLDLSNYEYFGYIGNFNSANPVNELNIDSNYRYYMIINQNMSFQGLNSNGEIIFQYTPYKGQARQDPSILNIKFSSDVVKINSRESGVSNYYINVYKEK